MVLRSSLIFFSGYYHFHIHCMMYNFFRILMTREILGTYFFSIWFKGSIYFLQKYLEI